jgi:hypothetical protein
MARVVQVSQLAALAERERVRAVYLTPHHHYPTTVTLSPGRRIALMQLARSTRMAVIEDDYDHEFHYEGRPVLPLASTDAAGSVIYVGTLSKVLAPGLRIGYVVAPPPVVERLVVLRSTLDLQGDPAIEAAVAELLEDGEVQRHVRRVRKIYQQRRDALATALHEQLGAAVAFAVPQGGMAMWLRAEEGLDVEAWERRGLARGVRFNAGRRFMFDERRSPCVRVGFAALDERKLREAVRRMVQARGRPGAWVARGGRPVRSGGGSAGPGRSADSGRRHAGSASSIHGVGTGVAAEGASRSVVRRKHVDAQRVLRDEQVRPERRQELLVEGALDAAVVALGRGRQDLDDQGRLLDEGAVEGVRIAGDDDVGVEEIVVGADLRLGVGEAPARVELAESGGA